MPLSALCTLEPVGNGQSSVSAEGSGGYLNTGWRLPTLVLAGIHQSGCPLDHFFITHFFNWLPDWFFVQEMGDNLENYSKSVLIITLTTGFFINGIFGPIIEELYFRGFLLPRISRFKIWAPLINTVLFSLYHFFTPWQNVMRIHGVGPMIYAVWWKKNIYLGMVVHCSFNIIGTTSMIIFVLSSI